MSWHEDRTEDGRQQFHRYIGTTDRERREFNPGPPTKSRKARSKIMIPGMHRTHPRRFA